MPRFIATLLYYRYYRSTRLIKIIIDYGGNTSRAETMRLILISDGMIESAQLVFDDIIIDRD